MASGKYSSIQHDVRLVDEGPILINRDNKEEYALGHGYLVVLLLGAVRVFVLQLEHF